MKNRLPGIVLTIASRAIVLALILSAVIIVAALVSNWFLIP
jgi:hypothetical protein